MTNFGTRYAILVMINQHLYWVLIQFILYILGKKSFASLRIPYCKVASRSMSWLVAHPSIFRMFTKGKIDAYVLWPLAKSFQNWIVDWSTARDLTVYCYNVVRYESVPLKRLLTQSSDCSIMHQIESVLLKLENIELRRFTSKSENWTIFGIFA